MADRTAVILPEAVIRVSYDKLREQVMTMAGALAAAGVRPGDRVATVMTNGLPAIVSFLAASIAGTAAPVRPAASIAREITAGVTKGRAASWIRTMSGFAAASASSPACTEA